MKKLFYKIKNRLNPKSELEILKDNGLKFGKNFNLINSKIDYGHCFLIEIGDDVTITHSSVLAHDASTKQSLGKSIVGKVKIGSRVFVGWGSIILPNVTIGDDVIVAAGSVVTKDIPNDSVVAGVPAKLIGKKSDYISKHEQLMCTHPIYDTYSPYKTIEEKNRMIQELDGQLGYDE